MVKGPGGKKLKKSKTKKMKGNKKNKMLEKMSEKMKAMVEEVEEEEDEPMEWAKISIGHYYYKGTSIITLLSVLNHIHNDKLRPLSSLKLRI